jgi:hypothetical protein
MFLAAFLSRFDKVGRCLKGIAVPSSSGKRGPGTANLDAGEKISDFMDGADPIEECAQGGSCNIGQTSKKTRRLHQINLTFISSNKSGTGACWLKHSNFGKLLFPPPLNVKTGGKDDVPFDAGTCLLHFLIKACIANYPCGISDFSAGFIQSSNCSDDAPFKDISQVCDPLKVRSFRPFIHHFHQTKLERLVDKFIRRYVQTRIGLSFGYHACNVQNLLEAGF